MSALSLKYPNKPSELADDLESFLYVILYMAFRFHRHNMSPYIPEGATREELEQINGENWYLGNVAHSIFWEYWTNPNGSSGGGSRKYLQIKVGEPPLKLTPYANGRNTPLALLIRRLYALAHHHYAAVDCDELLKYNGKPVRIVTQKEESENGSDHSSSSSGFYVSVPSADNDSDSDSAAQSSTEQPKAAATKKGSRVLDNHHNIIRAFSFVFKDKRNKPRDLHRAWGDKLRDQLLGVRVYRGPPPRKPSTKRQLDEEDEPEEGGSQKRARTSPQGGD